MEHRKQRRGTASSTNSSSKVHSVGFWSKLQNITKTVPELIDIADNSAKAGNNEDALRQYYAALDKERSSVGASSSVQAANILHKIGITLALSGDTFSAMNSFEEALRIRQDMLGAGSEEAAETTAQMLKILDEIRIQSGVGERQYVKGDDESVNALEVGTNLLEWGEYKEAEAVLTKCLKSMNDNDDSQNNNEEKIKVLARMAELDRAQGKYDAAKENYLEILKTVKKMNTNTDNEVDMSVINSIAGYAEILRKAGDLMQAEALHRKVRDMLFANTSTTEGVGDTDLQLAISHTQLGCTVFALKKYDDALREHQSALNIRLKLLELTDALVSESFNYTAETLCAMGREAEALPLSLQAVDIRASEFGTAHPAYAHALCILSKCYLGVGRQHDAMPFIKNCLEICESVFSENHANIIPNLIVQGDILKAIGELSNSLAVYKRAETIHNANFNAGQKEAQLEEIEEKVNKATSALSEMSINDDTAIGLNRNGSIHDNGTEIINGGSTPVIVITDIGRDIDDALALVILSSLKNMCVLNPLAVITTLEPSEDRACLARVVLDSLSMHDVPVGIGTDGTGDISLHCFDGVTQSQSFQFEPGSTLMARLLKDAEPKSVKLVCLANMKDISSFIVKHEDLFRSKIMEVVAMGGAIYSEAREQIMPDESASNNSTDLNAARHVYAECQQNNIPTTTISRYAAYGSPLNISFLDGLKKSNHLLAVEVRDANFKALQTLWTKCSMPTWLPVRGLPARCDKQWFLDFFHIEVDDSTICSTELLKNSSFYLYDSLAMLSCVDAYLEIHFTPKSYLINGTLHRIIGLKSEDGVETSMIVNKEHLIGEMEGLMLDAFKVSLYGIQIAPRRSESSDDEDDDEEQTETIEKETTSESPRQSHLILPHHAVEHHPRM